MTRLNYLKSAILAVSVSFVIASCDKIDEPFVIHNKPVDTSACPVPEFPVVTAHYKRALLEDYTGRKCVNCPGAAITARDLKEQYEDSLVVMAVHAGYFAEIKSSEIGTIWGYEFRTEAGTAWDEFFKVGALGNPNGMVSRKGYPASQQVLPPGAWANAVKNTIAEAPLMDLQLITEYNAAEDKLCIHAKTSFLQTISGRSLNLILLIIEDNIVQAQKNNNSAIGPTPDILDYNHMHVMRGAVNGTWGTPILMKESTSSEPVVKSFPMKFESFNVNTMVPANCHVIAFVYDVETKEVLQAAEAAVVE
jgi:hypothetical protein